MTTNQLKGILFAVAGVVAFTTGFTWAWQARVSTKDYQRLKIQNDSLRAVIGNIQYLEHSNDGLLRNYQEALELYRLVDSVGAEHFSSIMEDLDINK